MRKLALAWVTLVACGAGSWAAPEPVPPEVKGLCESAAKIQAWLQDPPATLHFKASCLTEFPEAYLQRNPNLKIFDKVTTRYKCLISGASFRVGVTMQPPGETETTEYLATYDGSHFNYMEPTGVRWLTVSEKILDAPLPMPLGTLITLPYAFLVGTPGDALTLPFVSSAMIADKARWDEVFKNSELLSRDEERVEVRFARPKDVSYIVTFSPKKGFQPTSFRKFGPDGKIQEELEVRETQDVIGSHGTISLPRKILVRSYLRGWLRFSASVSIDEIRLDTAAPDSSVFEIDPSSADSVWDQDNKVLIPVPK